MNELESPDDMLLRLCREAIAAGGMDPDLIDRIEVTDPEEGCVAVHMRSKPERITVNMVIS